MHGTHDHLKHPFSKAAIVYAFNFLDVCGWQTHCSVQSSFLFCVCHKPLWLSEHLLSLLMGFHGCLCLDGGAAACATLCYAVWFPVAGTERQLKSVSPQESRK